VWDKLRKQITVERQQLDRLLEIHRPLIKKCAAGPPSEVELSALAAALHSFYSGIEISLSGSAKSSTVVLLAASSGIVSCWIQ
jgi:hypothetical protein